jgi:putative transposase
MTRRNPFRYFKTSPEIIRLAVMLYVRFPLSLRIAEDLLHERRVDVSYESIRYWWKSGGGRNGYSFTNLVYRPAHRHEKSLDI